MGTIKITDKNTKETNKEFAYRTIRENILSFNLKPGQAISETELAEKLKISRTPIREIISRLRQEYLVDVYPQVGTYISLIDFNLINQSVFMRKVLEKEVLKLACEDFPIYNLIELEKNILSQKLIIATTKDEVEFEKLDFEFHSILFDGVGMNYLWSNIMSISSNYKRMRLMYGIYEEHNTSESVLKQHEEIVSIIKNKSFESIDKLIELHIEKPLENWIKFIKENDTVKGYIKNFSM